MSPEHYDVLVIGGGQAGIPLAHALAKQGQQVALAEQKELGGSCVNFGCTPTKAALASAELAHQARRASEYGLRIPTVEVDFTAVLKRARDIVMESRTGLQKGLAGDNPRLLQGHARLTGRVAKGFALRVGETEITAGQVVLNTGTRSRIPNIEGLSGVPCVTSENWLDQTELPSRVVMIGGGYIGVEMAQFYRRMGSEVGLVEPSGEVLAHEDPEVSAAIREALAGEGIEFHLRTKVKQVRRTDGGFALDLEQDRGTAELRASHIFIAAGRHPNTDDLGLEAVGVQVNVGGIVQVDERLATNVEGIWAAGDIRGGPMFTHTSWDDYRILLSQMTGDRSRTTQRVVPYAVFTDPELGRAGLTETAAARAGIPYRKGFFELKGNGKAREIGRSGGFIKVLVGEDDRIVGATVLGAHASEIVHMYVDLMNAGAPYQTLRDAVHIHPTLAEAVQSAVAQITWRYSKSQGGRNFGAP